MTLGSNAFSITALSIFTSNIRAVSIMTFSIIALSMTLRDVLLSDAFRPNMQSGIMLIDIMLSVVASLKGLLEFYSDQSYKKFNKLEECHSKLARFNHQYMSLHRGIAQGALHRGHCTGGTAQGALHREHCTGGTRQGGTA